ncbi:calcium-binding protein [Synechococcus elongatus]|uniref:Calcium-binding protein n=1 Tax=Synechococcus elongatus PCC 11802 TaxID=2283154 RepID=A0AAT9JUI1_SYNEL|nr:calcium-binding protein [Synechococcus elongatus]QFZ91620.1 calcium-binding protein [Synechococcus elongatus PCC 11802]
MSTFLPTLALAIRRLINTAPTVSGLSITENGVKFTATDITRVRLFGTSFALFRDPLSYVSPFDGLGTVKNGSETTLSATEQDSERIGALQISDGLKKVDVGVYLGLGTANADIFDASAANNSSNFPAALYGFGGNDSLVGGIGNDGLFGGTGDDTLSGGAGNDTLSGGADNDLIIGFVGADTVDGGTGDDSIQLADTSVDLNSASDAQISSIEVITAAGAGAGVEINLSSQTDGFSIIGSSNADTITGSSGNDSILGGSDNDVINYNLDAGGADSIDGGEGQDIVRIATTATQIRLTFTSSEVGNGNPNDGSAAFPQDGGLAVRVQAEDVSDNLTGSIGRIDDEGVTFVADSATFDVRDISGTQRGNQFNVAVLGTQAADTFDFGLAAVNYYVNAGQDNDIVIGGSGNDFLVGGLGADSLIGGAGDDGFIGGAGNDTIVGGTGADNIDGGADNDLIDGDDGNDTINGGTGDDTIRGLNNDDRILGGEGNDVINGNQGNDFVDGGSGNDTLNGGQESDSISGGDGNDIISGDRGADRLTGGADADIFVQGANSSVAPTQIQNLTNGNIRFDSSVLGAATVITFGNGVDVITDFQVGVDRLDIDSVTGLTTILNFLVSASNLPNNTLFIARGNFNSATNQFTFDADGGGDTIIAQGGAGGSANDSLFTSTSIFILEDIGPAALLVNEVFASTFI